MITPSVRALPGRRKGAQGMAANESAGRQAAEYECPQCGWNGYRHYVAGFAPLCSNCGTALRLLSKLGALDPTWCDIVASDIKKDLLSADELFELDQMTKLRFHPKSMRPYVHQVERLLRQGLPKKEFARRLRPIITEGLRRVLTAEKKEKVRQVLVEVSHGAREQGDDYIHQLATAAVLAMDDEEKGVADEDHPFFRYMLTTSIIDR